ncbi:SdiA-regulated domain-containing protein [Fulvivirga sediminis]|uniref:SdiA-regulated domain-containing protein n=1 Tax=Fulvivirga sediminis TaxID=2803949 RepID=A0A937F5V6_9BACT|nr:SdiA-regulated domain-containing protein [Fulvivirga sediminis]MBL3654870.1 SdiA-regulated domain-containing protein [Fulvivirga sediminis]
MKTFTMLILGMLALTMLTNNCNTIYETDSDSTYLDYNEKEIGYKFYQPDREDKLHDDLEETSGLAYIDENTLATIEDESGYLYLINSANGEIQRKIKFHKSGDYESVEIIDGMAYVMKSNGDLYFFELTDEDKVDAEEVETAFSSKNNLEGMCYDGKQLLIACKNSGDVDGNEVDGKAIYGLDLETKEVSKKDLFHVKESDLDAFLEGRKYFDHVKEFDPSGIDVHPITNDIYVISADHVITIFTADYKIKEVVKLDKHIYQQPEGICFTPDGTLYISSEGKGKRGRLFKLLYQK